MQRRKILIIGVLVAAMAVPEAASAQFSPRGILGAITSPLRGLFGHLHRHHIVRHRASAHETKSADSRVTENSSLPAIAGTLMWPSAYDDVVGYAFWPDEYGRDIQQHGFGDIARAVTGPMPVRRVASTVGAAPRDSDETAHSGAQPCASNANDDNDWPGAKIEQTIQLNDAQRGALKKLHSTYADGVKAIEADCRNITKLSPTRRLEAMEQRLWAVRDAGVLIREPLKAFYDSLTDEQKAKFKVVQQQQPPPAGKAASGSPSREQQMCFAQGSGDMERFLKQIQQTVRPTESQHASFDALRQKSSDMAKLLMASCTQAPAATPLDRLDAADTRLTAMNYAATTVDIALNDFYASLNKDQKTKFDALGR